MLSNSKSSTVLPGDRQMFKIENSVPVPTANYAPHVRYPFKDMAVGDSFLIPDEYVVRTRSAAWQFAKEHGIKLTVRRDGSRGVRCWRVA